MRSGNTVTDLTCIVYLQDSPVTTACDHIVIITGNGKRLFVTSHAGTDRKGGNYRL